MRLWRRRVHVARKHESEGRRVRRQPSERGRARPTAGWVEKAVGPRVPLGLRRERTSNMSDQFDLVVTADYPSRTAEFRLLDGHGSQIAYRHTDFNDHRHLPPAGTFRPAQLPAPLRGGGQGSGECRGDRRVHRRGGARARKSSASSGNRSPSVRCASSYPARARRRTCLRQPSPACRGRSRGQRPTEPTLGERHLLVRVVHDMAEPKSTPAQAGAGRKPARAVRLRRGAGIASAGGAAGAAGVARAVRAERSTRSVASWPTSSRTASPASGWRRRSARTAATTSSTGAVTDT